MPNKRTMEDKQQKPDKKRRRKTDQPEDTIPDEAAAAVAAAVPAADVTQSQTFVGSGRQAAQGVNYKEQSSHAVHDSKVAVKQEQTAEDELQAVQYTKTEGVGTRRCTANYTHSVPHSDGPADIAVPARD